MLKGPDLTALFNVVIIAGATLGVVVVVDQILMAWRLRRLEREAQTPDATVLPFRKRGDR